MKVKDIMQSGPICCVPEDSVVEAARRMVDQQCGAIPVVEGKNDMTLTGIITDRDIVCRAVAKNEDIREMSVADCMSSPAVSVGPDTDAEDCLKMMEKYQVRRLPVADENGECVGIVSQSDVARNATDEQIAELIREVSKKSESASAVGIA